MRIFTKQVEINHTLNNDEIEKALAEFGEPLRWAVVKADDDKFLIEAVFADD